MLPVALLLSDHDHDRQIQLGGALQGVLPRILACGVHQVQLKLPQLPDQAAGADLPLRPNLHCLSIACPHRLGHGGSSPALCSTDEHMGSLVQAGCLDDKSPVSASGAHASECGPEEAQQISTPASCTTHEHAATLRQSAASVPADRLHASTCGTGKAKQDLSWLLRTEPAPGYTTTAEATARQVPWLWNGRLVQFGYSVPASATTCNIGSCHLNACTPGSSCCRHG